MISNKFKKQKEIKTNLPIKVQNNNWIIPKDSVVELTMDLIIPDNISLTIEEGVKLKIKEGKSIILNGDLKINGTTSKPVIFESLDL